MAKKDIYRIGLDLGASSFKLVTWHTKKKQEKFRVMKELNLLEEFNLHETKDVDDTHIMEGIQIIMKDVPYRRASIRVSISDKVNNLFYLDIPIVNKNEMDETLSWSLNPFLNLPVDEYEKDYKVLGQDKKKKIFHVLVGTFEKSRLSMITKAFKRAGMSIDVLTSDQLALANLYINTFMDQKMPVGILDLGASSSKYSVVSQDGAPSFLKTDFSSDSLDKIMANTLGISASNVKSIRFDQKNNDKINKLEAKIEEAYEKALQSISDFAKDISMFNQNYEIKHGVKIDKLYLTGGMVMDKWFISNLIDLLKKYDIDGIIWEPAKDKFLDEEHELDGISKYSTALGLALL